MVRRLSSYGFLAALAVLAAGPAAAQSLGISPVTLQLAPGQAATSLTVTNQGDRPTAIQLRAFAWSHAKGADELIPSDQLVVSPPIATIAPGATQLVRLMLRRAPQGNEGSFRILLDQIPAAAEPGVVQVALRVSMPVFAAPKTRIAPQLKYHFEHRGGVSYLVAVNLGTRHETVRDVRLTTGDGRLFKTAETVSPYVLAGATRAWPIVEPGFGTAAGSTARLSARGDMGAILVSVPIDASP